MNTHQLSYMYKESLEQLPVFLYNTTGKVNGVLLSEELYNRVILFFDVDESLEKALSNLPKSFHNKFSPILSKHNSLEYSCLSLIVNEINNNSRSNLNRN